MPEVHKHRGLTLLFCNGYRTRSFQRENRWSTFTRRCVFIHLGWGWIWWL